jgi:hypothetical protein
VHDFGVEDALQELEYQIDVDGCRKVGVVVRRRGFLGACCAQLVQNFGFETPQQLEFDVDECPKVGVEDHYFCLVAMCGALLSIFLWDGLLPQTDVSRISCRVRWRSCLFCVLRHDVTVYFLLPLIEPCL